MCKTWAMLMLTLLALVPLGCEEGEDVAWSCGCGSDGGQGTTICAPDEETAADEYQEASGCGSPRRTRHSVSDSLCQSGEAGA